LLILFRRHAIGLDYLD